MVQCLYRYTQSIKNIMNFLKRLWSLGHKVFSKTFLEIEYLRRNKNFEKDLWLVKNFCDQSSISVDVGVNQGIFSRFMAKFSSEVLCFECNDLLYPRLHRVLPGNTKLCKVALSDRSGLAQLRFDPQNTGIGTIEENNLLMNNAGIKQVITQPVSIKCLDDYSLSSVSFIKIDIEGHELSCLKGSRALLEACRPVLLIEIEERHCPGNLEAVTDFLKQYSYLPFVISANGLYLRPIKDLATYSRQGYNNFWFLPIS